MEKNKNNCFVPIFIYYYLHRGKESNKTISEENKIPQFLGPPTSCYELGKFGYTLTGYYLVNDKEKSNITKVEMVFCQFNRAEGVIKGYNCKTEFI